ncbi:tRNA(Ile)-lysidine synthase [Spiroplasma sp. TIUS-1]|uniref:tRNA lysidine(34) synthetase TilS n=1 Tax=Spiroplasma sp. TIUS-1 TaxID=216963 RepID=UPI001397830D|nr:tRNA lysidine(34) synthetase TilS [Spiroplasma sp. TIUS-1]QHX35567.1 tRNA(Ile)-lysidine synthase [Spiroplasma sp. TIUS-1]
MDLKEFKLVIGVSGGPDSMYLLNQIFTDKNYGDIIVCHVNYNFRDDSSYDQFIVEDYCKKNNIKIKIKSVYYSEEKGNFEEWARLIRYNFFVEEIRNNGFSKIVIAHNLNDHAETFLMQTLRKSIVTYYGINPIGEYDGVQVLRPILDLKKSFILNELNKNGVKYAVDSTNEDESYLRNKIRKTLTDKEIDNLKVQAELENKTVDKFNKKYEHLFKSNSFDKTIFVDMDDFEINRFVYCWIKNNDSTNSIMKKKKKFVKEVVKQLGSSKNLKIVTDHLIINKQKNQVSIEMVSN